MKYEESQNKKLTSILTEFNNKRITSLEESILNIKSKSQMGSCPRQFIVQGLENNIGF
jgi:hypothetical protein